MAARLPMAITVDQFAQIVGGGAHGFAADSVISGFATDNREVAVGDLFLAIRGARVDGHDFAADAIARGAVGSLVERTVEGPHVLVPNLVDALAAFAAYYRDRFKGPVIGVTGSAGKTTAKEFIAAALSPLGPVLKTLGNRNTEYTVPLIWAEPPSPNPLPPPGHAPSPQGEGDFASAVIEMSMRGFGQIRHLASFSKPTIGVVTNVGYSHLSEVGSREGIAEAKAELLEALPSDGVAVLWAEDEYLGSLISRCRCPVVTFGFSGNADCHIGSYHALNWRRSRIGGNYQGEEFEAELPAVGRHIAVGAAAAIALAVNCGVPVQEAATALANAELPPMRMEVVELNGATVLLDTYNAAPPSMNAAIETFVELPCEGRRIAVIGEMRELGEFTEEAHRELGVKLATSGIDEVIFYSGPAALAYEEARMRGVVAHLAKSLDEIAQLISQPKAGDAILVKGSRSLELEKTVEIARGAAEAGS